MPFRCDLSWSAPPRLVRGAGPPLVLLLAQGPKGSGSPERTTPAFANLGDMLALAKYPNVAVKLF